MPTTIENPIENHSELLAVIDDATVHITVDLLIQAKSDSCIRFTKTRS